MKNTLTKNTKELFLIYKQAVEAEQEAQKMYKKAISLCENQKEKTILEKFLDDEINHELEIVSQYNKLKKSYSELEHI